MKPDVLIIGAGITGISAAFALQKKGLSVVLVERDEDAKERFRGEYLQPFAVKGLTRLGLGGIFDKVGATEVHQLRFRDLKAKTHEIQSQILIRYPEDSKARVIPNRILVEELRILAREAFQENFQEGVSVVAMNAEDADFHNQPIFNIQKKNGDVSECRPRFVIGGDGRQSSVREWMKNPKSAPNGAPTLGAKPEFIVGCELLEGAAKPGRYEVIRTAGLGTLSFFQINPNKQRVYWNAPATKGLTHKKYWETELLKLLQIVKPHLNLKEIEIENIAGAPANTTWMGPSAKGCFFLAGDALSITTPFGGQGMSCSFKHIEILSELLSADTSDLDALAVRYEEQTRALYNHVNMLNFGLYYLFFAKQPLFKHTTSHILKTWNENPEMAARLGRLFGGDDVDTPDLFEISRLWGLKIPSFTEVLG